MLSWVEHEKNVLIVGIFMTKWNFMLSWVEHEKSFITSSPVWLWYWSKEFYSSTLIVVYIFWSFVIIELLKIEFRTTWGQEEKFSTFYHNNPMYWDTLPTYHTSKNSPFYCLWMCLKYYCMYGKQCRRLIWVYIVCTGLSVPILRVIMVLFFINR